MHCKCRYIGQDADRAAEMVHFMWQHDTSTVAQSSIKVGVDAHGDPGPQK